MPQATPQLLLARQLRRVAAGLRSLARDARPEPVHAARVALRRLRTILAGLAPAIRRAERARLRRELARIAATLGALRDADIRCAVLLPLLQSRPAGAATSATPLVRLANTLRADQRRARQLLRAGVADRAFADRLHALQRIVADPQSFKAGGDAAVLLRHALRRRLGKLKRMLQAGHSGSKARHALRIQVKKCRYLLEACGTAGDSRRSARIAARLHELQDCLGELNDIAQVRRWLARQHLGAAPLTPLHDALRKRHRKLLSRLRALRTDISPGDLRWLKERYS